ncbi:MAG: hypothetical protein K9M98_06360 [Cephaloticoccus sp.]|nr:hypothetical protein [Cephaloticoccus sp.]MCF7760109.1 hypothetical protein [Cephaloticoccus sp.]
MTRRLLNAGLYLLLGLINMVYGGQPIQGVEDRVEVANVRFNTLRPPDGSDDNWFEVDIELDARPAASSPGRVTKQLRVVARLAYDRPGSENGRRWEFFRASGELVGLAAGRAHVRFYLPPEIVKRDSLGGAPEFWEVTLSGESLVQQNPPGRKSPSLSVAEVQQGFRDKIATEGQANDGILQVQYLTPFATAYPRSTPTYVRHEAWR